VRIDIFPDLVGSIASAEERIVAGVAVPVLTAHSVLDHKLLTLTTASSARRVDRKHFRDAIGLAALCARSLPPIAEEFLTQTIYSAEFGPPCERCAASIDPLFPLAPKQLIVDLPGYV